MSRDVSKLTLDYEPGISKILWLPFLLVHRLIGFLAISVLFCLVLVLCVCFFCVPRVTTGIPYQPNF